MTRVRASFMLPTPNTFLTPTPHGWDHPTPTGGPMPDDTRWMTYDELAKALGIGGDSAPNLVRRKRWPRRPGNDGLARVGVPVEHLTEHAPTDAPSEGAIDPPADPPTD